MDLQKSKQRVKQKIYPFINEIVDTFYNDTTNDLIERVIENDNDKSVFLMFVMMYYGIHLKLDSRVTGQVKRDQIKILMTELIKDPQKRQFCIEVFENKFQDIFTTVSKKSITKNNERLVLENKDDDKFKESTNEFTN